MLFLSSEYWKVHYLTQISHPAPFQMAPAFSKTDVVEQVMITVGAVKTDFTTVDKKTDKPGQEVCD